MVNADEELKAKTALRHFIHAGTTIVNDRDEYDESHLDKLDKLLFNMDEVIGTEFPTLGAQLITNRSFVTIAEGKTQAAFTFRKVKPLYFPISEDAAGTDIPFNQSIYNNFKSHIGWICAWFHFFIQSIVLFDF